MPTIISTAAAAGAPAAYDGFDRMLLNGRWTHGGSGQSVEDVDPYTNEVLLRIPLADQADLDAAFAAAAAAQPAWSRAWPATRAAVLRRAAAIMESRRAEIIDWLVHESGSTRLKAELEWNMARAVTLEASSFPSSAEGVLAAIDSPGKESRIYRQPVGVVGMIGPWNFPLHLSSRSVAPAIALGNAVVVKPASDTPVSGGLLLGKIYEEAGVPAGVLNVLIGKGRTMGDAFVRHPVPRVVSFTG
jgi:acyl-CoA reductase-like NAD-dependent aldehyde dehydrogenase